MEGRNITLGEHKVFGNMFKSLNDILVRMRVERFNEAKTKEKGRRITLHEKKAIVALSRLRDNLEEIMYRDYPETREFKAEDDVYYGRRKIVIENKNTNNTT